MKLTYRGISYQAEKSETEPKQMNKEISLDKHLNRDRTPTNHKIISVRPIHYYTYRGISYTKNLIFDRPSKLLLDIDRK